MNNRLPEKLTLLRKHYGYAQGDIAQKLGIPVTEYMKWENGNTIPPILKLKEISDLYKVTLDSMADNTKDVILPALESDISVDIPFMNADDDKTQVIGSPAETQQETRTIEADLGSTIVMDTQPIQETQVTQIADEEDEKTENDSSDSADSERKKKLSRMIIGFAAGAALLIGAVILLMNLLNGNSSNTLSDANRLALGDKFSLYIDKGGSLVRHGTFEPQISFDGTVQIDAYNGHVMGLKPDGVVVTSDNNQEAVTWSDIVMVASGRTHSVCLKKDGTVECTGSEAACRVGTWENIKSVYAGNAVTVGITNEGKVVTSGSGLEAIEGQSGIRSAAIGDSQILLVHENGTVSSYSLTSAQPFDTSSWTDIKAAAVGSSAAVGLRSDGTVVAASADEKLIRKIQAWTDIRYIDACGDTVVAVTSTGALKGAGDNSYGQYVASEQDDQEEEPEQLEAVKNITFTETTANVQVKWDKVKNADYYEVSFSPSLAIGIPRTASSSASVPSSAFTDGTEYTVTVIARSDDEESYTASEPTAVKYTYNTKTVQLSSVTNVKGTGDVASWYLDWSAVDHADYYIINIDSKLEDKTDRPVYVMDLTGYEWTDGSEHTVSITAYSNSATYSQSEPTVETLKFNLPKYNVTVNIAGTQQVIQLTPGHYTLAEILAAIEIPEGFTVTDDIYTEYSIESNYGLTVNGTFEAAGGEDNG